MAKTQWNPLVSIVIPVYNGSNYVKTAIESALAQTYTNCEVIVVNDGSNDGGKTDAICRSFGHRIRYFTKENGGVATAVNLGIQKMRGEYFAWLSHDDVYYPEKIEKQIAALAAHEDKRAIVHSDFDVLFVNTQEIYPSDFLSRHSCEDLTNSVFPVVFLVIHGCSILVHKSHFERVGLYDPSLKATQDSVWLFHAMRGMRSIFIKERLFMTRIHKEQGNKTMKEHGPEWNKMFIHFCQWLTDEEKAQLCGSAANFYYNLYSFLLTVPKADECLPYLRRKCKQYRCKDPKGILKPIWYSRLKPRVNEYTYRVKMRLKMLAPGPYSWAKKCYIHIKSRRYH